MHTLVISEAAFVCLADNVALLYRIACLDLVCADTCVKTTHSEPVVNDYHAAEYRILTDKYHNAVGGGCNVTPVSQLNIDAAMVERITLCVLEAHRDTVARSVRAYTAGKNKFFRADILSLALQERYIRQKLFKLGEALLIDILFDRRSL